ncbi:axonemal dynein light intermediate polypeptide 1 [Corvus hawaiiensis]|uniref:Axonemal dynein light intermediate polypeptide 1 n=1 Tax=Corvus moneduloides TaxID=1196302 RepID=A0A8C3H1Y3_CORMO|nr:axonemal dynein light intermediate polypeptide 1 isoform X1 [Corvus moneduloides]XP_048183137.1 axonemal dynein light intermediate polypeptide 1 [Corvus hawaiiensis]
MAAPPDSLLRYCPPALVSRRGERASAGGHPLKGTPPRTPASIPSTQQPQELLNAILPPREWEEAQKLWVQEVSTAPSTRRDVVLLQEQLDRQLQQRQARETGLCPVRRELYTQCFDELIRQTTVSCAERGLLLLRVRDELQLTLSAYQALYESSVAFGVRKALQAEQGKAHMEKRIAELEEENRELEKQVSEEKAKCEAIERQENERREIEEKKHSEEVLFLKRTNQQLKTQLESIVAAKN